MDYALALSEEEAGRYRVMAEAATRRQIVPEGGEMQGRFDCETDLSAVALLHLADGGLNGFQYRNRETLARTPACTAQVTHQSREFHGVTIAPRRRRLRSYHRPHR